MNLPESDRDELRIAALLRTINADAAPPNATSLDALRQRSANAFSAADKPDNPATPATRATQGRTKLTKSLRWLIVLAATAAAILIWWNVAPNNPVVGAVPFSKILDELRGAKTLQLRVTTGESAADVWVRAPGLVRREESPQRYQIAAGSRLWQIDETENTSIERDSPWFLNPQQQVDLLSLLEIGVKDASALLTARPVERMTRDGRDCFVYRVELPAESGRLEIEAIADAQNLRLMEIVAWGAGANRRAARPLAELRLVAVDVAVDDEKFVVAKSLTEDGRIGKISDVQGIVVLRPVLAKRWSPVGRETLLKPGDWLRTELRGANAVKITLSSEAELTLGPGSLVECISTTKARLHSGQVQVYSPKTAADEPAVVVPFELLAPRDGSRPFKPGEKQLVRLVREAILVDNPRTPVWLAGFEGTTNNESLGSLIVNLPDGRNEPLTVGYHKVNVEIRDQIARTTIEESFVNHTDSRLEGTFHFPLPQDASISGFGMWIGNDLIEADVVEKQRAREIYETILHEKRDPGLLEWTGGNLFKARVFPIEAHSEKRIKIVYTQVLPLRANRYRYSYGLRSELLRTKPLRDLSLTVTVNSALPLKSIACPTHSVRTQQTAHAGQVEFAAQEHTPTRDFEVVCEIDGRQSDVVVVPHRRGNDGYFLLQLTPPAPDGNWQRELLPDGHPLHVVLLCDTSASMDSEKRKQQAEFVAAVLMSLGTEDRFLLACADVGTVWASPESLIPNAENIERTTNFLDRRRSLGWTNLDRAFADTLKKAPANSHVIYIGDGIVSSGDTEPAAFVKRLGRILNSQPSTLNPQPSLHAISVGNSYESVVLKGIASVGGGSVRAIGGEQTPRSVALEWLNEIAQPGLRDLRVEFRGLKVAGVYPDRLPNVSAGTQQILVGRYLPEGKDQRGEVVVTGQREGEAVRYVAQVNLKDAEEGNSFIPRLWARAHLDLLLAQGQSAAIQDEIIGLSEEFHIITPFTSLLVLETDADRERFGVKRRYEMRDGERFFATGRDNANYELRQAQMKRAADWRLGLRRDVLRSLARLGRNSQRLQQQIQIFNGRQAGVAGGMGGSGYGFAGNYEPSEPMSGSGSLGRAWFYDGASTTRSDFGVFASLGSMAPEDGRRYLTGASNEIWDVNGNAALDFDSDSGVKSYFLGDSTRAGDDLSIIDNVEELSLGLQSSEKALWDLDAPAAEFEVELQVAQREKLSDAGELSARGANFKGSRPNLFAAGRLESWAFSRMTDGRNSFGRAGGRRYNQQPDYTSWINTLFPTLDAAPGKTAPPKKPEAWSPEAIALSKSLLRSDSLGKLDGGIELRRVTDGFDVRWQRRASRNSDLALYSPNAWLTRPLDLDDQTVIQFCDAKERGVFSLAFLLGRVRASVEQERKSPPLPLDDFSLSPLHESYRGYLARIEPAGENRAKLILTVKHSKHEEHFTIDAVKHVLVKREWFDDGKPTGATNYTDFVEVAGSWWAKKSTTTDARGRKTAETSYEIQSLGKEPYGQRLAAELAAKPTVQFLRPPFVKLKVARQKVADGSANFDDRMTMILYNANLQQWDEMWKHVEAAEKLTADKPGVRWMRTMLLGTIRRHEEGRQRLLIEAKQLAANRQPDETFLAAFVHGQSYGQVGWPEFLEFVEILKPVYVRQPAELDMLPQWQERLLQCFDGLSRHEEALALRRAMAEKSPWHLHWQTDFANRLARVGKIDAAFAWLQKELDRPVERETHEDETLRSAVCDLYRGQASWNDLLKFTAAWIERKPDSQSYNSAYAQHLSALVFNDQFDVANALAEQWLREARIDGPLAPDQRARLETAINFANGSAFNLSFQRADERWFESMAETIRYFLRHKHHSDIATRGIGNHYFLQSDIADQLRGEFLSLLRTDLAKLTPQQINALLGWTSSGRIELREPLDGRKQLDASEVPSDIWKKIAAELKPRWVQAQDKDEKHLLGESLRTIYANRFHDSELLPFLRERLAAAHPDFKATYVSSLFETLLTVKWSDEIEQEAFSRLLDLSDAIEPMDRLAVQLAALHRLVDAMLANRHSLAETKLGDQGEQNKLTRKELAAKKAEFRKTAREQLSARLLEQAGILLLQKRAPNADGLAMWMRIEKAWLDVGLDQHLPQVEELCWQILGEAPPKLVDEDDDEKLVTDAEAKQQYFDGLLKQRAFTTVMNLAARRKAEPATIAHVLKYIDAGIAHGGDMSEVWRNTKFRMLVALDRPDDLDRELRGWIRGDVSTAPWRQALAKLVAERGKLDEAIQLFEACEKDKLLSFADYRMLADWYLVTDRRAAYERSRVEAFKQMPEHQLSNSLHQVRNRWYQQNIPLPSELDENTLFTFRALFEKSASPEIYLSQLRDIYAASRDFRLLQMIPDAVLGRSPQQVYSFLNNLQSQVLYELRNEATADEILARVKHLRANGAASAPRLALPNANDQGADAAPFAKTLTTTDLRALDLLEALVERRSSEVLNQPGPHVEACLAALQRAFQREWSDGEPRLMATFLFQLGTLRDPKLIDEQLGELRELRRAAPASGRDHLWITNGLCNLLFSSYGKHDDAIREMEAEVRGYALAQTGTWPHEDNGVLGSFVTLYEGSTRHGAGEAVLQKWLEKPAHDEQRKWLRDRRMSLYNHSLEHNGAVSLGSSRAELFPRLLAFELNELKIAPDENVRHSLVTRLAATFDIAHRHKLPGVADAVRTFAFETMPMLLKRQTEQYRNTVAAPQQVIGDVLGPRGALQYVVERMEQYPQRLEIQWDSSWQAFGYELGRRREEAAAAKLDCTDLEPRMLKLAIRELKRELRSGESRNPYIFHQSYGYFWAEKSADFARAADEVLAERRSSGRRAVAVANYLWDGIAARPRAIEVLLLAHKNGLLDDAAQSQLIGWLHKTDRFAESIALLEPLVEHNSDTIHYRTDLMEAYFHTQRPEQLGEVIAAIEKHFHAGGRWTEDNVAQFARGCFACKEWKRAIGYFNEAIALHQRANPGSGLNDARLSDLYSRLAEANGALGRTKDAVEAASAAIVCWPARHEQRRQTLNVLNRVLTESPDLDDYVHTLDQEAAKTGQDSPILRKAIGETYRVRNEHEKAIPQFQFAIDVQPNDKETHTALIACYDATDNKPAATAQLLKLIDLNRHDLQLFTQLADRLKNDEAEWERAATSIIESAPNEAENHAAMAELRQSQNRWGEAIPHWQHVAELRRLEPNGLLQLATAQLHEKQWDAARQSIEKLQKAEWPSRFNDVAQQTRVLSERLSAGESKGKSN